MELNTEDTRYVSGENSYAQWYEPITVFKLGLYQRSTSVTSLCIDISLFCILIVT